MKRLLVHLHIYYHDQTDFFIEKLSNISGCEWCLYVTMSEYDEGTERKIRNFWSDAHFMAVENYGYDIWPFIKVVKSVNLDDYDYILKLHTKNSNTETYCRVNLKMVNGLMWRNGLVDSLLKSGHHFRKLLAKLDKKTEIGLICSDEFHIKTGSVLPE